MRIIHDTPRSHATLMIASYKQQSRNPEQLRLRRSLQGTGLHLLHYTTELSHAAPSSKHSKHIALLFAVTTGMIKKSWMTCLACVLLYAIVIVSLYEGAHLLGQLRSALYLLSPKHIMQACYTPFHDWAPMQTPLGTEDRLASQSRKTSSTSG